MSRTNGLRRHEPEYSRRHARPSAWSAAIFLLATILGLHTVNTLGSPQVPGLGVAVKKALRQPLHRQVRTDAVFQEFPLRFGSSPTSIVAGPDGAMWFTDSAHDEVVRMTMGGAITAYPVPLTRPQGIAVGPDGNIWFCRYAVSQIGRLTPSGLLSTFNLTGPHADPVAITRGPDANMWVSTLSKKIARITMQGAVTEFPIPSALNGIAAGPDGNLWSVSPSGNWVGRMTTAGTVTVFPLPTPLSSPLSLCVGPDGNLWVTTLNGIVARVSMQGEIAEYATGSRGLIDITAGPDGNLWITAGYGGELLRLELSGRVSVFPTPYSSSYPFGIAVGPDGNVWFTDISPGRIVRLWLATTPVTLQSFTAE